MSKKINAVKSERLPFESNVPSWNIICISIEDDAFPKDNEVLNAFCSNAKLNKVVVTRKKDGRTENYRILVWERDVFDKPEFESAISILKDCLVETTNHQIFYRWSNDNDRMIHIFEVQFHTSVLRRDWFDIFFIENGKRNYIVKREKKNGNEK